MDKLKYLVAIAAMVVVGAQACLAEEVASPPEPGVSYALVAHTYKTPGLCAPCDRARPVAKRLADEYPIEFVYADSIHGYSDSRSRGVDRFPTFRLVRRDFRGERELLRWSGADMTEQRIREAFRRVGIRPRPLPRIPEPPRPAPKRKPSPAPPRPTRPAQPPRR